MKYVERKEAWDLPISGFQCELKLWIYSYENAS